MFGGKSALALDIGSKSIKIIYGKVNSKNVSIINYGICSVPGILYSSGDKLDKDTVVKSISNLLSENNIKTKYIDMGIKGSDIIMRHIEMPIMPVKELRQAVRLEIQQFLPMDLQEYIIDSKIISKIDTSEKKIFNVLLVAAPKSKIQDYINIAEELGMKVRSIDIFSNSIVRFFENHDIGQEKTVCVIDIGYVSSTVNIIEKGKLFLEKEIPIGIKNIDDMLGDVFANSSQNIEELRKDNIQLSLYDINNNAQDSRYYYANNSARQIVDMLIDNIGRILSFYYTSGMNKKVDTIYLYGGGAKINGITEYMRIMLNIDTRTLDVDLMPNVKNIDVDLKNNIEIYANSISLLLRKE